jgi:hypothetical protein
MWTAFPWTIALESNGDLGIIAASRVQSFTMPEHLLFPTFAVVLRAVVSGAVQVSLRFGFEDADTDAAIRGINFAPLTTPGASDVQSAGWAPAAAPPFFGGSPPAILPPRVAIFVTTDPGFGFNGLFDVYYCGILVP